MKLSRIFHYPCMVLAMMLGATMIASAQTDAVASIGDNGSKPLRRRDILAANYDNDGFFTHLDVGLSLGTTGLGIDLSTNLTKYARVRLGADWTPPVPVPMSFSIHSYTDGAINEDNFEKLQHYMQRLTGIEVDDVVEMHGKPEVGQFKLMVDYFPVPEKGWRVTAGFFLGKRRVASALNTMGEMPSLLAVNIYNHFYDYFMNTDFFDTPIYGDIFLDPFLVEQVRADLVEQGTMGIHVGDFRDGTPYIMQPDTDGMVKAKMYVNSFRPYLGVGYTTPFKESKRFIFDADFGIMMWGGTPKVVTHEGVNLTKDVVNIKGRVGSYTRLIRQLKVYPTLTVRVSFRAF